MTVIEPLMMPCFDWGRHFEQGLTGIQAMTVQINLANLAAKLWSRSELHPAGDATVGPNVAGQWFSEAPRLLLRYTTPSEVVSIPKQIVRSMYDIQRFSTVGGTLAAGAGPVTLSSSSINLQAVPSRIYVWLRRRDADQRVSTTDTYAYINNISINFDNKSGLLSSASAHDLYQMSRNNGCDLSWTQWSKHVGSVLAIDLPQDIGLSPLLAPGVMGTFNLQFNVSYTNTSRNAVTYDLYTSIVTPGCLVTEGNRCSPRIGMLSSQDVLDAKAGASKMSYNHVRRLYGGSWFGNIKQLFSGAYDKVRKVAKTVAPIYRSAVKVAKMIPGISSAASTIDSIVDPTLKALGAGKKKGMKGRAGPVSAAQLQKYLASQ